MDDRKKISAIAAAVTQYLDEEAQRTAAVRGPAMTSNLWQASGRQEIMMNRTLWQRRIVPLR